MSAPPGGRWPAFPTALAAEERELKRFLYARLYDLPELKPVREEAERVVANLAAAYRADPVAASRRLAARRRPRSSSCARSATSSPA